MSDTNTNIIAVALARVEERQESLKYTVDELRVDIAALKREIDDIHDMVARWRGGIIVILALGGFIGWFVAMGEKIVVFFRGQ